MATSIDGVRLDVSPPVQPASGALHASAVAATSGHFGELWRRLGHEIDRGERLVTGAAHASVAQLDAGTLIALQAGIYRYSEAIDLTVKLVDRVSTAVRTVLESGR